MEYGGPFDGLERQCGHLERGDLPYVFRRSGKVTETEPIGLLEATPDRAPRPYHILVGHL